MTIPAWVWTACSKPLTWTRSRVVHGVVEFSASAGVVTPTVRLRWAPATIGTGRGAGAAGAARWTARPGEAAAHAVASPDAATRTILARQLRSAHSRRRRG